MAGHDTTEPDDKESPMRSSRRWDRKPETPADTRLCDLRESGYTGPIDQDGYARSDPRSVWFNRTDDEVGTFLSAYEICSKDRVADPDD